jgi:hypothetical protein
MDWTTTEIIVTRGQRIHIAAEGEIDLGDGHKCGPEGIALEDKRKLMSGSPTGALIAVIGDDNDDFILIGKNQEFTAKRNGRLFLGVNGGDVKKYKGSFTANVEVESAPPPK